MTLHAAVAMRDCILQSVLCLVQVFEELGRTLSTLNPPPTEAVKMWESLLSNPLTHLLHTPTDHPSLCSQSCSVLSTIGPHIMRSVKVTYMYMCPQI